MTLRFRDESAAHGAQVVIAGGGPVGMATAIELGLRGVSCVVIEQRGPDETFPARTNVTNARTMEHFRRWGIADRHRETTPFRRVSGATSRTSRGSTGTSS